MNKKVIFFDVDGTLLDFAKGMPKPLESTIEVIKELKEKGHFVVVATGRPKPFLPKEILKLDFDGYITANGAVVEHGDTLVFEKSIEQDILKKAIDLFETEGIEYILEGYHKAYFSNIESKEAKAFYEVFGVPKENITDNWKSNDIQANKMVVTLDNKQKLNRCQEVLGEHFVLMNHPGAPSWDMYFRDCTKADGIQYLLNHLGLSIQDTIASGDGDNDMEMIQLVNTGVAMGNGKEELKKHANYVTDDVFSHGIINALKHLSII